MAVAAATREEFKIAAAGERESRRERLVEIALEHAAPDQHAAGAVDHVDGAGPITARLVDSAQRQPMMGIVEHRQHGPSDDIGIGVGRGLDHLRQPCRVGVLVIVEHRDVVGSRHGARGAGEAAVIRVGLAAARLDDHSQRKRECRRHRLRGIGAGATGRVILHDHHGKMSAVAQSADMIEQLAHALGPAEGRDAEHDRRPRAIVRHVGGPERGFGHHTSRPSDELRVCVSSRNSA